MPEKPKHFFAFGQAMHEALEFFHSRIPHPSIEELLDKFSQQWSRKDYREKGYATKEKHEADYKKGCEILTEYYARHCLETKLPFLLEYKTEVEIDGLNVIIVADKIEYLGSGLIKIVDYKTGKPADRTPEQLYMYQKICENDKLLLEKAAQKLGERLSSIRVDSLIYYYLEGLKEKVYLRAADKEIGAFWEKALRTAENIKKGKFEPSPSEKACNFCDFKALCPIYSTPPKNGAAEESVKYGFSHEKDALELALSYGRALLERKAADEKVRELEEKLLSVLREEESSFEGDDCSVSIKKEYRYEVKDRDGLIEALKKNGVYEKMLWPIKEKINEFLSDPGSNPEIKEEIKKHLSRKGFLKGEARKKNK
ncbi:MAG: hypothetical protein Fur0012_10400 [Elusimicrobiota bacterium]